MSNSFELVEVNNDSLTASSSTEPLTTSELIENLPVPEDILPKPIKSKKQDIKPKSKPKSKANAKLPLITEASPITETPPIIEPPKLVEAEAPKPEEPLDKGKAKTKLQEKQECPHCKKLMSLKVLRYTHPNKCTVLNKVMKKTINKNIKPEKEVEIIETPEIIEAPKKQIEQKEPVIMKNKYVVKNEKIDKIFSFLKN